MDETLELIKKSQEGDNFATETLIKNNVGLIWNIVKKFYNRGYEPDDLFQIGSIGLLRCIQKFDAVNYNVKFSTYAVPMIIGEIKRFLRDDGMIKISRPLKELAIKAKYAEESYMKRMGAQPTVKELAAELNVAVEELIMAMDSSREVEYLYQTVNNSDAFLIDKLSATQNKSDSKVIDVIALKEVLEKLTKKERQIIVLRYFKDKTQTEIAKRLGISQVQVSRIEKKVLQEMKNSFE